MASHRVSGRRLSRYKDQRKALMRGLVCELITHERITTTLAKAKETRIVAEKLITHGKKGNLHHRRLALAQIPNKKVVEKVFDDIAPAIRHSSRWLYSHHQAGPPPGGRRPDGGHRAGLRERLR